MQWHELVFSKKPFYRLLRHALFCGGWWLYFSIAYYFYQQPFQPNLVKLGSYLVIKTFLLVNIAVMASYAFIYVLLPWLTGRKWLKASIGICLLAGLLYVGGYLLYWNVFPFIDSLFGPYRPNHFPTRFWPAVTLGLLEPLKVVAAAVIFKFVKYWWEKQKESEQLKKEKINAELQLLKAQIHPNFLFTALNNIYDYSLTASPRAPEMLFKLSDLLSYMLYECNELFVPLEREIQMMQDYMALEQIRLNNAIEVAFNVRGDIGRKMIAPFLLLPFIENSFKQSNPMGEQSWMNMDISVEGCLFVMKLANGITSNDKVPAIPEEGSLLNAKKRLNMLYPQRHELKITGDSEMLIVLLKINLAEMNGEVPISEQSKPQSKIYAGH